MLNGCPLFCVDPLFSPCHFLYEDASGDTHSPFVFPQGTVWFTMCVACPFLKGNLWHFKNITATEKVFSGIYQIFICNPSAQNLCKKKNTDDLDSMFSAKIWSFRFQLSFIWAEEEVQLPSFESQSQWWYLEASECFHNYTPKASLLSELCSVKMSTSKHYQDRLHG